MGVVRERKVVECPALEYQTDPESVNSGQISPNVGANPSNELEDYQFAGVSSSNARRIQNALRAYNASIKSGQGQRKTRRALNNRALEDLVDNDVSDNLMDDYKSPFERLMEITDNGPECINDFLNQLELDNEYVRTVEFLKKCRSDENKSILNPYYKICHKIRRSIKLKKNFRYGVLRDIERNMLDFFKSADLPFSTVPLNSFERLLFHAVAQYHGLFSITTSTNDKLTVHVTCIVDVWKPQRVLLCDYLQQKLNTECSQQW